MKYEIYKGQMVSSEGVLWEVRILQELDKRPASVGELEFPASEPLTIEWGENSKEDVVIGSIATLKLISPGDRTYEGMYSITPGAIRMDVHREGQLYWSGTLDPEFYEEPYTAMDGYEVELTFSDFGILDRLKYDQTGRKSCRSLLDYALQRSGISYSKVDESGMTTTIHYDYPEIQPGMDAGSGLGMFDVRSDNFYDEDGEPSTLREMLEGILRPLALRMEQRNGKVWIYDLNGAYTKWPRKKVEWMSDDQMLGVDKVVNNAKITLSTYSSSKLMDGELTYPGKYSVDEINLTSNSLGLYSYYVDYDPSWGEDCLSFTIFLNYSNEHTEIAYRNPSVPYFHIQPLLGADEATGLAYMFMTGGHGNLTTGWPKRVGSVPSAKSETVLLKTQRVYIPKLPSGEEKKYYIRLVEEILIDSRYNPYTTANDYNEKGNQHNMEVWFGYVMIPAAVTLYDEKGNPKLHYSNENIAKSTDKVGHFSWTKGEWKKGAAKWGEMWLEWYDPEDRAEKSGVGGWKGNRHCIGLSTKGIYKSFGEMDDGEYIPYPDQGGYLEVTLYIGIWPYDYKNDQTFGSTNKANSKSLYDKLRWMLYKAPKIDIVRTNITKSAEEMDDIEYSSFINVEAKEDLELNTICGTAATPSPTSKAIFLKHLNGEQVREVKRAGRRTQTEELLLGTLYSQFADRKTKLEGTASINAGDPILLEDINLKDKRMIVLGDVQDIQSDTSELILVELRPDEYKEQKEK